MYIVVLFIIAPETEWFKTTAKCSFDSSERAALPLKSKAEWLKHNHMKHHALPGQQHPKEAPAQHRNSKALQKALHLSQLQYSSDTVTQDG